MAWHKTLECMYAGYCFSMIVGAVKAYRAHVACIVDWHRLRGKVLVSSLPLSYSVIFRFGLCLAILPRKQSRLCGGCSENAEPILSCTGSVVIGDQV